MRTVLHTLVTNGNILLHGSPHLLEEIHPHFADDEIAICATPFPELAIIMAIFKACKLGKMGYTATLNKKTCCLTVRTCEKTVATLMAHDLVGYVYVIDADGFSEKSPFEYRIYNSIYAQKRIAITKSDLPFMPTYGQTEYKILLNRQLASVVN
ncbi:MAG: hypothetical protein JWL92_52 [Candidatus Nomurabacteria bacterium]|nr:hypothetical protein [Candidatus Nomurabacteria bacterium]